MSSGWAGLGTVEAVEGYSDKIVDIRVTECWGGEGSGCVEVAIAGLQGHDHDVTVYVGNDEARQLAWLLLEAAKTVMS